ncbi:MAG: sarcosine oxidase subunit gamma [Roseobacter sp.]
MHDLAPLNALGGDAVKSEVIGHVTLTEVADLALASVAARLGSEQSCAEGLAALLGTAVPGPNAAVLGTHYAAVWMAQDQWMLGASFESHEDIAAGLKSHFGPTASITEQTDAWVTIDLTGENVVDLLERLCAAPARRMKAQGAQRTVIHQMGCFLVCGSDDGTFFRVIGPRSSAGSLWHALTQAALSVRPL